MMLAACAPMVSPAFVATSETAARPCGGGPYSGSGGAGQPTTITCGTSANYSPSGQQPPIAILASLGTEEIRLQRRGGGYLVPVAVNGLPPIPFVLDSGADVVMLPAEVVFTLIRTGTLQKSDF